MPVGDAPRTGREFESVFGVDAAFNGMPLDLHIALAQGELLAGGDQNLLLHQVDTRDHFGNGMFDLNTRIHFYEEKLAIFVQEFEGAGATVIDLAAGLGATLADAPDQARSEGRRVGKECGSTCRTRV